jgi:hypothetical protein
MVNNSETLTLGCAGHTLMVAEWLISIDRFIEHSFPVVAACVRRIRNDERDFIRW